MRRTLTTIAGTLLLCAVMLAIGGTIESAYDNAVEITQVRGSGIVEAAPRGGLMLVMHFETKNSNRCQNQTQNWLRRSTAWMRAHPTLSASSPEAVGIPLAPTLNGIAPPNGDSPYGIRFVIPPTVDSGEWEYYATASYTCHWLRVFTRVSDLRVYGPFNITVP